METTARFEVGRSALAPVVICLALGAVACRQPPSSEQSPVVDEKMTQEHEAEVNSWHGERLDALRQEESWLTLVGLFWLEQGVSAVGSDPGSQVVLPESVAASLGTIERRPESIVLTLAAGQEVLVDGQEPTSSPLPLATDATGDPTVVRIGTVSFYCIERGDRIGVRVKDSAAAARAEFAGIERFPVSWQWRLEASYTPHPEPVMVEIPTALGTVDHIESPGVVRFEKDGESHRLDAFAGSDAKEVWFVFGDRTNGRETYGGGRFLYAHFTGGDSSGAGPLVVDFNRAYNPPCVFTPYATCPLPTAENRLALAVEAGEKYGGGADH